MEEKVVDRRVRKTKRQLRLALMKLMAEKSVKDISVRELAAIADINRGTFYIHYKDVYDLLSSLEDELAEGLVVVCRRHNAKDSEGKTYPYLMELYQYIEQNADLCHVLLGKNGDIAFTDRICHILRDEFLYDFLAYYYPNDPAMLDYFCSFIVSGNMSLALTWIDGGMKQTAEEMAVLAGEIIMHGVKGAGDESISAPAQKSPENVTFSGLYGFGHITSGSVRRPAARRNSNQSAARMAAKAVSTAR